MERLKSLIKRYRWWLWWLTCLSPWFTYFVIKLIQIQEQVCPGGVCPIQ